MIAKGTPEEVAATPGSYTGKYLSLIHIFMALLGENGSGKTTLMNMLSGIYHPDAGSILVGGEEVP